MRLSIKQLFKMVIFISIILISVIIKDLNDTRVVESKMKAYENLVIAFKEKPVIEYGSNSYDLNTFVEEAEGQLKTYPNQVDTNKVGEQLVYFEVAKNELIKSYILKVEVKDSNAPIINFVEDTVTLYIGDEFVITNNISSVNDIIDGNINYLPYNEVKEDSKNYYTYTTDLNPKVAGNYTVNVKAVDINGNIAEKSFSVIVKEPIKKSVLTKVNYYTTNIIFNNNMDGSRGALVSLAYSLLGSPYIYGGSSPSGFDCAGLVSYLYSQIGISISKSSSSQAYLGTSISLNDMKPGDIIIWGNGGVPNHTAIYVGNGNMIHAANPRKGVILSNVLTWQTYGQSILSVRTLNI